MKRLLPLCSIAVMSLFYVPGISFAVPTAIFQEIKTEKPFTALLIQWETKPETTTLEVRTKEYTKWSPWYTVTADEDRDEHHRGTVEPEILFNTNESTAYQYRTIGPVQGLVIEPFSYGKRKNINRTLLASLAIPSAVNIITRTDWGADYELLYSEATDNAPISDDEGETGEKSDDDPNSEIERVIDKDPYGRPYTWPVQYAKEIKFIVIHHTATAKNLDNPEVAIQNIYAYHALRRGWGDIGYNFLIDQQGNIYEGRQGGDKVIGGHALALNKVSVGIGILGDFQEEEIPAPVLKSLLALTNTLTKKYGIDPNGTTEYKEKKYENINGHRDSDNTTCPGNFLYQKLVGTRELVDYRQKRIIALTNVAYMFTDAFSRDVIFAPPDSEKTFTIRLKNTGQAAWNEQTYLRDSNVANLGLTNLRFITKQDDTSVIAILKSSVPVEPGEIGVFEGKFKSSLSSALMVFDAQIVANNTPQTLRSLPVPIMITGVTGTYEVVGRHDPKNLLAPGERTEGWIELRNTSNVTWRSSGDHPIRLHPDHPRDRKSEFFERIELTQTTIAPGEIGRFIFSIKAPAAAGTYTEYFTPVIEHVRWLKDQNLAFNFVVQGATLSGAKRAPDKIRIALAAQNLTTVQLRGSSLSILYDNTKILTRVPNDQIVTVTERSTGKFRIVTGNRVMSVDGPVRMRTIARNGYIAIENFERRPAWDQTLNDNIFLGTIEIIKENEKLRAVNELPLESYIKGLAEVSNDEHPEKMKAIIVAARSYARYYMTEAQKFPGRPYNLDDDPNNTQKYLGYGFTKRAPNLVKASEETKGEIVTYQGKVVKTPYFSQSDGRTRSGQEVFGWTNTPYLQSVPDPWCSGKKLLGHGVGLSGCGAKAQAVAGKTYEEIIKYYYKGVEITD